MSRYLFLTMVSCAVAVAGALGVALSWAAAPFREALAVAFPAEAPHLRLAAPAEAAPVLGRAEARAFLARRERRSGGRRAMWPSLGTVASAAAA